MTHFILVAEREGVLAIGRDDLLKYTGPSQIIACTLSLRLFARAFADLSPGAPPRRESISVFSAFPGEGVIDCIEMITRACTIGARLTIDPERAPPEAPAAPKGRFYFEITVAGRGMAYMVRPGFFDPPFVEMVTRFQDGSGSPQQQRDYLAFKHALIGRLMGAADDALFASRPLAPSA